MSAPPRRRIAIPCALTLTLALALLAGAPAAAQKKKGEAAKAPDTHAWYAQRLTRGDTGVIVFNLWSEGRRLRAEAVIAGMPLTTIVAGEFYYVIDRLTGRGLAIRRSTRALQYDREHPHERPFGTEGADLIAKGAEEVRRETLGGRDTVVYRLTDDLGRHEVWVTDDETALPLQIDSRAGSAQSISTYVDWLRPVDLPDAFFEPDPRVEFERIEYDEYVRRASQGPVGPAPVLFADLLHGPSPR